MTKQTKVSEILNINECILFIEEYHSVIRYTVFGGRIYIRNAFPCGQLVKNLSCESLLEILNKFIIFDIKNYFIYIAENGDERCPVICCNMKLLPKVISTKLEIIDCVKEEENVISC